MLILSDTRKPERAMSDCQGQLPLQEQQAKVSNFVKLYQNCVTSASEKIPFVFQYVEEIDIK